MNSFRVFLFSSAPLCFAFFSLAEAEESIFDFSATAFFPFHQISKEKVMNESRVWKKGKSSLRKTLMRRDKNGLLHGHVHDSSLNWDWGLRNGIKCNDSDQEWLIAATYTHFHSKSFASLEKDRELLPTWHAFDSSEALELGRSDHSRWRLDIDMADLEVGKSFSLQNFLNVRPHLGVRTTWMYQKFEINYEKFDRGYLREPILWNNCLGIGTRGGVDTIWALGNHISFFGDGALSWLSGYTNIHERQLISSSANSSEKAVPSIGIAMMEYSLGVQYESKIPKSIKSFNMKCGYEFNYFLNKNRWVNSFSPITNNLSEKISLEGLSM